MFFRLSKCEISKYSISMNSLFQVKVHQSSIHNYYCIYTGKKKVKDMNIYIAPIVDELKQLWSTGVQCFDASSKESFTTKAILLWTMHDYPGYGVASSLQTQGFFGFPPCGPDHINSYSAKELDKIIYHGYRRYLPEGHPWRSSELASQFNGKVEPTTKPPLRMDGWDWLVQWEKIETGNLQLQKSGMTGLSKLYDLEYWAVRILTLNPKSFFQC